MRMLAFAHEWRLRGGKAVFASAEITAALRQRLHLEGFEMHNIDAGLGSEADLATSCRLVHESRQDAPLVVLDGYQFGADFQIGLKKAGCRLLVMDDYGHASFYYADWILNQHITAHENLYRNRSPYTELLLGPKFALLRREFLKYRGWRRVVPDQPRNILVTFGGSDHENLTLDVVTALADSNLEITVIVGGSYPHLVKLRRKIEYWNKHNKSEINIEVNPPNMPELMARSDLAIAAGGSTCLELAFFGVPGIYFSLAENQREIAKEMGKRGLGFVIPDTSQFETKLFSALQKMTCDPGLLRTISARLFKMVDGLGAGRVVSSVQAETDLHLRTVTHADLELLYNWANDPTTRSNSFVPSYIPWTKHKEWFKAKISDPRCWFWIAGDSKFQNIGCVRIECASDTATISLTIAPEARGKGYSRRIIERACENLFESYQAQSVHAFIKPTNIVSIKAFESAGFQHSSEPNDTFCNGQAAIHLVFWKKFS